MAFNYRKILAKNVESLKRRTPALNSNRKIAKACSAPKRKIGARTIGHMLNTSLDAPQPQLDTIVAVAEAFKVEPWMLLNPDFDPEHRALAEPVPPRVMEFARNLYTLSQSNPDLLESIMSEPVSDAEVEANGYRATGTPDDKKPTARQLKMKLTR